MNGSCNFYKKNTVAEIDVTNWTEFEIMDEVEQMLEMSNEEIMKKFNIEDTGSAFLTIALLTDDIVQEYFDSQKMDEDQNQHSFYHGDQITRKAGNIKIECTPWTGNELFTRINIVIERYSNMESITIDNTEREYIQLRIVTPPESGNINTTRIYVEEIVGQSELIKQILEKLEEKKFLVSRELLKRIFDEAIKELNQDLSKESLLHIEITRKIYEQLRDKIMERILEEAQRESMIKNERILEEINNISVQCGSDR